MQTITNLAEKKRYLIVTKSEGTIVYKEMHMRSENEIQRNENL